MTQSVITSKNPRPIRIRGYAGPIDLPSYWGNDLDQYAAALKAIEANAKRGKGRPSIAINNPFFYGYIGEHTHWSRYPFFAEDILEGITRLDWHGRGEDKGGSSKPLCFRRMSDLLSGLEVITTDIVGAALVISPRHARRYVKALEMALPRMMSNRPACLAHEMQYGFRYTGHGRLAARTGLFAGSLRNGKRAAAIMSLIQSACMNGHDPHAYLKDVLSRLPMQRASEIDQLLPHQGVPA